MNSTALPLESGLCSKGQPEIEEVTGRAMETLENCGKAAEEQGNSTLLEERRQQGDPTVVSHTSCTTGSLLPSQEEEEAGVEQEGSPASIWHDVSSRQDNKRTTKTATHATNTPGNDKTAKEASAFGVGESTHKKCNPGTERTPLPIKAQSGPSGEGKWAVSGAVVMVTTMVEKQEGEKWEVGLETSDRETERHTLTETKQPDIISHPAKDSKRHSETKLDLASESATESKVAMGQEQSQDLEDSQSDPGDPGQPDSRDQSPQLGQRGIPKSMGMEKKTHRAQRRDGGWELHGKEPVSQTVWYDNDPMDLTENGQLGLSSPQASGLSAPQPLEQGLSFCQLSSALSQLHGVGVQPAPSHGPGARKQEVHGSQHKEEVGEEQRAVEGGGEVGDKGQTNNGESGERAETEGRGREKRGSEERGEKRRKKRRRKRGKRGSTDAKRSSSSSIESQSQIERQRQGEKVTDPNTQSDTRAKATSKTGGGEVQSLCTSEPVRRKEADRGTMHLPSQTEGESRNSHGPDCGTTPELIQTDLGRKEIPELISLQSSETKEFSEEDSMDFHGSDGDLPNPDSSSTPPGVGQLDLRGMEVTEFTALQPLEKKELSDLTEPKGLADPVELKTPMDKMESTKLLENEDIAIAVEAVASVELNASVGSDYLKDIPLKGSDPSDSTETLGFVEFPKQNTQLVQSTNPSEPVEHLGKPMECIGSAQPTEAMGRTDLLEAQSLLFEGTVDVSPVQIQEGNTETTAREYLTDDLGSESLREQQNKAKRDEEKKKESRESEEEMGEVRGESVTTNTESQESPSDEEMGREEKRGKKLSSTNVEKDERREEVRGSEGNRSEEFPPTDMEEEQSYNKELAATVVAVVTVAIASAVASIELSQWLADSQSDSKTTTQSASKDQANNPPSAQPTKVPTKTVNQLPEDSLFSKDHANSDLLVESHAVLTQLDTDLPAETENQPAEHSHMTLSTQFTAKEQTPIELSKELDATVLTQLDTQCKTDERLPPERENQQPAQPTHSNTLCKTQLHKGGIQPTATTDNRPLTLGELPKKAGSVAQVSTTSLPESNEIITTQVHSQGDTQTEIQQGQDSQLPCPFIDTGQCPKASAIFDAHSNENLGEHSGPHSFSKYKSESVIQRENVGDRLDSHFQEAETYETDHSSVAKLATLGEVGCQTQGSLDSTDCKAEERESCEESFTDMPNSESQARECKGVPHPDSQVEKVHVNDVTGDDDGVIASSLPPCGTTFPVSPCDSPPMAHSNSDSKELTAHVSLQSGTSQSLPEARLVTTTSLETGHHPIPLDNEDVLVQGLEKDLNALDTMDGWKERARKGANGGKEARREMITAQDRSQTDPETFLAAREQHRSTETNSDSTHTLEIQRERDTFYPLQPYPEPNTTVTCTALCPPIHPDTEEECVSVCVLQRDTVVSEADRLTVRGELDESVFKKLEEPVPGLDDKDRGIRVSWSSTDDSTIHEPLSTFSLPSQDALSVATTDTTAPWSSRNPRTTLTEERGGEVGEGGGDEEERKDQLTENPFSPAILRASLRSLSPSRHHSWEQGRNDNTGGNDNTGETGVTHRSSLKSLSVEVKRTKPPLHRRSMSWCPSNLRHPDQEQIDNRSYSLEGLEGLEDLEVEREAGQASCPSLGASNQEDQSVGGSSCLESQERGRSLVSLTEEEQGDASSIDSQSTHQVLSMTASCPAMFHPQTLTKSISMVAISHRETDAIGRPRAKRRLSFSVSISLLLPKTRPFFSVGSSSIDETEEGGRAGSFSSSGSLKYSISEEEPGPLRSTEGRGATKVSRTFSYLRSKMSKKSKEKDKEKRGEKEHESKERERRTANSHLFTPISPSSPTACQQCSKPLNTKEAIVCNNCGSHAHKSGRESLAVGTKGKMKQSLVSEAVPESTVNTRSKSTSSSSTASSSSSSSRERWSVLTSPEDQAAFVFPRRNPSILSFSTHSNLAKSISTSNIAGLDDVPLKGLKFLSQSTDSLHQGRKVNASTESLSDEGTEMMDSQLMGEFECEVKDLEADSWSATVDKKFLKMLKKDEIKRQDVIYELYQTEFHHVRTLRIMSEVYYKGIQQELQLDTHTLDKIFPMLEDLLDTHTHFLTLLLERKRASLAEGRDDNSFLIRSIGDILVNQFSGCKAEGMKKVYGKFCSSHNKAVNLYKELHTKDKRFQAFIKRKMSSSIVRRLSIPECILLVTQRITKYPVLIQRILQHTKDTDEDHGCVSDALHCVKELITAVDSKVNEQEKKRRLREVYSRTDSKSIMRMKSGQMFAKEDLMRGRRLLHDGALQLKNSAGRLKDVHAMLLSDVLVFLQEKDQKYVFASLDQRSTVISLQKLIVREVANEERGLFLITAGIERPEMVEVLASSKDERNIWMAIIQDAMHCMEKDEDEGVPSETEEDRRQQENRAKEIRELLRRKDEQIISLLEEKVNIFRDLCDCNPALDDTNPPIRERMLFRAAPDEVTKGEPIMKDALREVETLHALVNSGLGRAGCSVPVSLAGVGVGPVCLPRRAETFGGFDSHQMNSSKNGEKEDGDESLDLRRTESDSVLKKGTTTSLQMLLKRNNEQFQHSVTHLHDLLTSLQAVVVQQDSFIEDQRQAPNDQPAANSSSRNSSSSSLSSLSRPSSLIEQEKQRSLERQRQEAASLQKQQAAHQEEKRRREREWEMRERGLAEREVRLKEEEEEAGRRCRELEDEREKLQRRKDEYQRHLERLREAQRRLERDKEALRRDTERMEAMRREESGQLQRYQRTSCTTSEDSMRCHSSGSLDLDPREAEQPKEVELSSSAPTKEPFLRIRSKRMGKNFNPFSSSSSSKPQGGEESQLPTRLLQLTKTKEKKEKKKKKKGKGEEQTQKEGQATVVSDPQNDGDVFFC